VAHSVFTSGKSQTVVEIKLFWPFVDFGNISMNVILLFMFFPIYDQVNFFMVINLFYVFIYITGAHENSAFMRHYLCQVVLFCTTLKSH